MSDHSSITINLALGLIKTEPIATVVQRRRWRDFDRQSFSIDLASSMLTVDPSSDVASLFACYDGTLLQLVDKHASLVEATV